MKFTDEARVGALTLVCILLIALLFNGIIRKPVDLIAAVSPFYFFFIYLLSRGGSKKSGSNTAWNVIILLVTVLVILIYAIK